MKKYTIRSGFHYIDTYGFKCAYCGRPLSAEFGDSKQLIAFSKVTCPNCLHVLKTKKDIEYEPEE